MKAAEKKLRRFINKLSYKLLAPLLSVSFFFLLLSIYGKDARLRRIYTKIPHRRSAAENFAKGLRPEEAEIFWGQVFNVETGKKFKNEYKKAKKSHGIPDEES